MNPKYQVFVSSTFEDLKDERDLVIKAILEMGHIPVGMEMFSAADEEQWAVIKKQIDQSDYYVVIVAHRYGTTDSSGLSYTEKEYDYAAAIEIPILGFIVDDQASWPKAKSDTGEDAISKINAFKSKIRLKPVSFWKGKDDLYGKCSIALMKAFNAYPREGWVKASLVRNAAVANEIVRLSAENADLRSRIDEYERVENKKGDLDKLINTLKSNKRKLSYFKKGGKVWEDGPELSLYQIFESVAPQLQVEKDTGFLATYFAQVLCKIKHEELRVNWPSPRNSIDSVLADLSALRCVTPSGKKKPVSDTKEYWVLTDFGRELLGSMRRRRLEKVENSAIITAEKSLSDK